jgi:type I restriction enzyme S subunit
MSICATIGRPIIVDMEACIHDGFVVFKNLSEHVNNLFFLYWLKTKENYFNSLGQQGTQKNLNTNIVKKTEILLPPLPVQRKIAAILSSVDEAIEKTEAIIEQTEKVKKGLMQQLLTKGIGHTKFKKTEIGEIPEEWEVRKLEEVTLPKEGIRRGPFGGALKKEIFVNEGYAVYEQQHVINNNMREFRYFIDEKKFLEMKPFEVIPGDILISCSGTVGKVAIVPENAKKGVINQALLRLRLENKLLSNLYAWYLFSSDFMQSKMTDMSHGSTLKNIVGMTELRKISIPIPPLDEQMEIVSILTSVDQMHQNERQRLSQLQTIKKGLMQSLLTGKVRVKVNEDEVVSS